MLVRVPIAFDRLVEIGRLPLFGHIRGVMDDLKVPIHVEVRVDLEQLPPFWFEIGAT